MSPFTIRPPESRVRAYRAAGVWRDYGSIGYLRRWRDQTPQALAVSAFGPLVVSSTCVVRSSVLQSFEHRRERGRIHLQCPGNVLDRQRLAMGLRVVPQRQHHQILRMGQPERLEQRPVDREHRAIGDGQRETHLAL